MARPRTLLDLLDNLAPQVRKAFLESFDNIRSDVQLGLMIASLERGDIDGALRFLNIETAYFAPLDQALVAAYVQGGDWTVDGIRRAAKGQGATIVARFDGRNVRAEEFVREQSGRLITGAVDFEIEDARIRLTQNMIDGVSPKKAALDLVGRVNPFSRKREGGVIGLDAPRRQHLDNMRLALSHADGPSGIIGHTESGAPIRKFWIGRDGTLKSSFGERDRRFDRSILKAIKAGERLPASIQRNSEMTFSNRLLRARGESIARTELLGSLHASQAEGTQQLIDAGKITRDMVSEAWDASNDNDTRESHAFMEGQERGVDGAFTSGDGFRLLYPGDTSLGAPASEVVQCRCRVRQSFDFSSLLRSAA